MRSSSAPPILPDGNSGATSYFTPAGPHSMRYVVQCSPITFRIGGQRICSARLSAKIQIIPSWGGGGLHNSNGEWIWGRAAGVFQSHQFMATPAELDNISPDDPRLSPGYYAYYYSQRRLDPRLPPPLVLPWSGYGHYDDDDSNGNLHGADGGFPLEPTEEDLSKVGASCSHASVLYVTNAARRHHTRPSDLTPHSTPLYSRSLSGGAATHS